MTRPRKIVCILGMHRSGTSAVTRILNIRGMDLGRASRLIGPTPSNPEGHWEYQPFSSLNDRILRLFGGRWDDPPDLPPGWEGSLRLIPYRQWARLLARMEFRSPFWGWKDPRTSMTLPFWRSVARPTHHVVCLRNPSDVAASLHARNDMSFDRASRLWVRYARDAVEQTDGRQRLVLFYEDLMADQAAVLDRLERFLVLPPEPDPARTSNAGVLKPELQHHSTGFDGVLGDERLSSEARALFESLWRRFSLRV